jgi:hypothetical protein
MNDYKLPIADCQLANAKLSRSGMKPIGNPQSAIGNRMAW